MGEQAQTKFHEEDLPKILTAVKEARELKQSCTVIIAIAPDGGVLSVMLEAKKKYK